MILEQGQYLKSIKEELDSISVTNSTSFMNLPVIESVEAFSKTQVYQSLRKGQLSDEELSFVISNYNYANSQLNQLIFSKVKDLTMTKAISIGAISAVLAQRNASSYYDRSNFEYDLRAFIKIKDYESELIEFIKFFNYRKTHKMDKACDRGVFESFLKTFWYDHSKQYLSEDLAERTVAAKAIKNHYKDIYELLEEPKKIESSFDAFVNAPFLFHPFNKHEKEEPLEAFEQKMQKEENRNRVNRIIITIFNCPYADMDFLFDLINDDKKLEPVDKIYLLIACLISSYAPSFIDFNECLSKIEILHKMWGVKESLADLTLKLMSASSNSLNFALRNLKDCKKLTKERKKEIYLTYFTSQKSHTIYGYYRFKMDLMIILQLDDKEVADFLRNCVSKGDNVSSLKSCYFCTPSDRNSYPGPETLLELAKGELRGNIAPYNRLVLSNRVMPSQRTQISDEDLTLDNYYFNPRNGINNDVLITWEMANNPEFMRKIIFSNSGENNYRVNKTIAKMNLKSIGFKKYVTYLEDYARKNKLNTFSTVSKNALRYATQSELYMYKRMIPEETLCSSPYINFKLINYFLSKYEATNEREDHDGQTQFLKVTLVSGVERNKILSKGEFVNIIARLGKGNTISFRLFSVSRPIGSRTSIISIKTALSTKLTVKDFSDYYDSLEEVK